MDAHMPFWSGYRYVSFHVTYRSICGECFLIGHLYYSILHRGWASILDSILCLNYPIKAKLRSLIREFLLLKYLK